MPFSLDECVSISRATNDENVCVAPTPSCDGPIAVTWPGRPLADAPVSPICVNGVTDNPWPTPPSPDPGCNPVTVGVNNTIDVNTDTTRLNASVSYINNDPCLPKLDLTLVSAPPLTFGGGFSGSPRGWAISHQGKCSRIFNGPTADYRTPADYFANEAGAGVFIPADINENSPQCPDVCTAIYHFSKLAKFNLIGPMLGQITEEGVPTVTYSVDGQELPTGWRYTFELANCVQAGDACWGCPGTPELGELLQQFGKDSDGKMKLVNVKENTNPLGVNMTPGMQLERNVRRGAKPQPLIVGTQVMVWGFISTEMQQLPTAESENPGCSCTINWFCDVVNDFDGDCDNTQANAANVTSNLPVRTVESAGFFHGVDSNVDRV